jgi:F420-non-reducing hydrogenase small subunit
VTDKLKIMYYWMAGCGGCEVALLDIDEKILDVAEIGEILFWPIMMDAKETDVEAMEDNSVDLGLVSGSVRNNENAKMARLMREKSKVLVSVGACANWGGIISLANLSSRDELMERVYDTSESTTNPEGRRPFWGDEDSKTAEERNPDELEVPKMYRSVYPVTDVVEVDYLIPGCPPPADVFWDFVAALTSDEPPEPGIFPDLKSTVCETCPREKRDEKPDRFYRPFEIDPDPDWCLMEQGIPCVGAATRDGCGALCPKAGMPCRGCFGPADGVLDQGAKFLSSVAAKVESDDLEEIERRMEEVKDIVGTGYRFTLGASLLRHSQEDEDNEDKAAPYTEEVAGS